MGIVVGVIGLVLLGASWWLAGVGSSRPREHLLADAAVQPPASLLRSLQQYLAGGARQVTAARPQRARALRAGQPHGTTCPVAAGSSCSLKPCIVYAGSASAVLVQAVPAPILSPARSSCQGHPAPPRTLLVGGA
jgi:hypothetical protein